MVVCLMTAAWLCLRLPHDKNLLEKVLCVLGPWRWVSLRVDLFFSPQMCTFITWAAHGFQISLHHTVAVFPLVYCAVVFVVLSLGCIWNLPQQYLMVLCVMLNALCVSSVNSQNLRYRHFY
jgi:hypothetical protein